MPEPYVEKDFWVIEVLRAAAVDRVVAMPDGSTAPVAFLFKRGTRPATSPQISAPPRP
jgi:hypothetical protein